MRRSFPLFLFFLISLSLFSAGQAEEPFIGVVIYSDQDAFIAEFTKCLETIAEGGAPLKIVASGSDQETQNAQIAELISQGAKALIVNTVDRMASGLIIEKGRQNGVPLVFFNRQPLKDDMLKWDRVYYVGSPGGDGGSIVGEYFSSYWKEQPELDRNGDGVLQFVIIIGEPGHQDTELRTEYLFSTLTANGLELEKLGEASGNWWRSNAKGVMNRFLASYGDSIEAVFCNNDEMAVGAIEALKENGWFQDGKYMPVTGVDGTPAGREVLEEGTLFCTVFNDAEGQARAAYELALELMNGKVPRGEIAGFPMDGKYVWVPYQGMPGIR